MKSFLAAACLFLAASAGAQDTISAKDLEIAKLRAEIAELKSTISKCHDVVDSWRATVEQLRTDNRQLINALAASRPVPQSSTTTISGSGGVYTTHGSSPAGRSTIIRTAPGHYEIRHPDGTVQRVIQTGN